MSESLEVNYLRLIVISLIITILIFIFFVDLSGVEEAYVSKYDDPVVADNRLQQIKLYSGFMVFLFTLSATLIFSVFISKLRG